MPPAACPHPAAAVSAAAIASIIGAGAAAGPTSSAAAGAGVVAAGHPRHERCHDRRAEEQHAAQEAAAPRLDHVRAVGVKPTGEDLAPEVHNHERCGVVQRRKSSILPTATQATRQGSRADGRCAHKLRNRRDT